MLCYLVFSRYSTTSPLEYTFFLGIDTDVEEGHMRIVPQWHCEQTKQLACRCMNQLLFSLTNSSSLRSSIHGFPVVIQGGAATVGIYSGISGYYWHASLPKASICISLDW